jgi:hypothetical protein
MDVVIKILILPGVVAHTCNLSTREAEAGGSQVQGQPRPYSETLTQKTNKQTKIYHHVFIVRAK